jgi:hypothetical protein
LRFERVTALVLVGGILSALLAGCGGQKGERASEPEVRLPTTSEAITGGVLAYEFVGEIFGTGELVAIVADKTVVEATTDKTDVEDTTGGTVAESTAKTVAESTTAKTVAESTAKTVAGGTTDKTVAAGKTGAASSGRRVRAYVCDGEPQGDAEWFTGQMTGNTLDLTSESGSARLQAELSEQEAAGTVTLADGILRRFSASAAREGAGLYEVTIERGGQRSGTSANGAKDEGQVSPDGVLTTGTIRLPSGEAIDYRMRQTIGYERGSRPDTYTTIILPGAAKERGRGGDFNTGRPSSNFISNDIDL